MLYILQNQEKKAQPQAAWSWQVALWPLCMQVRCTEAQCLWALQALCISRVAHNPAQSAVREGVVTPRSEMLV